MGKEQYDYIIVGQGIAGSLLAFELIKLGMKVIVIDDGWTRSSSVVAAGIINPITGKNFVHSWRYRDFMPVAIDTYKTLSQWMGRQYLYSQPILRTLETIEEENLWLSKTMDPYFDDLIASTPTIGRWGDYTRHQGNFAEIKAGARLDISGLISDFKNFLIERQMYLKASFDYSDVKIEKDKINYLNYIARSIVFCEGAKAVENPFFKDHQLSATKGEVLIIRCTDLEVEKMYKKKFFVVPLGSSLFWVGAGYEWNTTDPGPTQAGKAVILDMLHTMLKMPSFEIIDHKAGIRPTVQTRRPILKVSHIDSKLLMLNGLGTKGALSGPYLAQRCAEYLQSGDSKILSLH
jgi:glycine/D-amino acid oxidase-like deaminating enzyme